MRYNKGATPIEKNIIVIDERGNEYEATYPKRAKGLVKNGRARFVDDNKICLACPPSKNDTEDIKMSENITNTKKSNKPKYTVEYILSQMKEIRKSQLDISEFIAGINAIHSDDSEDTATEEKVRSLRGAFVLREGQNEKMLDMYNKMIDALIAKEKAESEFEGKKALFEYAKTLKCEDFDFQIWNEIIMTSLKEQVADLS